jgi:uncharacterized membrane protein
MRLVAATGLLLSIYLVRLAFSAEPAAGCGPGTACDLVLRSRWSSWLGMPVSLPGASWYASIVVALGFVGPRVPAPLRRGAWGLACGLSCAAAAAAVWFLGVQALALRLGCPYCLGVHACGMTLALLLLAARPLPWPALIATGSAGLVLAGALPLGQWLVPPPAGVVIEHVADERGASATDDLGAASPPRPPEFHDDDLVADRGHDARPLTAADGPPGLALVGGRVTVDPAAFPRLGPADAPHVVAKLFDYTCSHCRTMHGHLQLARERYGSQLAVICIVVPLDPACHPGMREAAPVHAEACELARLSLAVWRIDRQAFWQLDAWLFATPQPRPAAEARAWAERLVGPQRLNAQLAEPGIERQLRDHAAVYRACGAGVLPKLLARRALIHGDFASGEQLCEFLEAQYGLVPQPARGAKTISTITVPPRADKN